MARRSRLNAATASIVAQALTIVQYAANPFCTSALNHFVTKLPPSLDPSCVDEVLHDTSSDTLALELGLQFPLDIRRKCSLKAFFVLLHSRI